ncbi:hypothetical protein ZIOFF_009963 [Zingiber officinale]|uniref:S-adenosyl-L-methionine-dependent methyltransferase superfamily protein n=1 Tax=Zingiber officinale TaxID=94328 RepID=A0A8J5HGD8_ZINOF|nr:hypothetical protein ZIOFF_009963 [Zingiber officinale]
MCLSKIIDETDGPTEKRKHGEVDGVEDDLSNRVGDAVNTNSLAPHFPLLLDKKRGGARALDPATEASNSPACRVRGPGGFKELKLWRQDERLIHLDAWPKAEASHSPVHCIRSRGLRLFYPWVGCCGCFSSHWLLIKRFSYCDCSGGFAGQKEAISIGQGVSCSADAIRAIPILKKAYGDSMRKVLHVGLDSCAVVSNLLKEKDTEAWGVEPYDLEDADSSCKSLVRKGFVRSADIKFPLPYRPKSFSLVVISDSLDYLSSKYLNKTLPDIARVSSGGLVIFAGSPGQQRAKILEPAQIGRPAKLRSSSSWVRYFIQTGLEENEMAIKKFEQASRKSSYEPSCQIFHLGS